MRSDSIQVKLIARELTPGFDNGEFRAESGVTVKDVLALCAKRHKAAFPSEDLCKLMYPLYNGKPLTLDSALSQDGTLHICRIAMGG